MAGGGRGEGAKSKGRLPAHAGAWCAPCARRGDKAGKPRWRAIPCGSLLRAAGVRYASLRSFVLRAHCSTMAGGQERQLRPVSNRQQMPVAQPHGAG
ncbi:hypothetical protein CBM2634_B160529 [Cupriavidus taiwanensis]|uniref:Uncharacterized protein n=1 Tax=Cupriavidus taiwanensis TaxID=164546 RepID=A0A375J9K3_9BURK|nr:hypothetical protein CBM2634_B160529 [Cupriavidus taiwanensis]